jgi:transcriptional regulator with XRE-family HTH domain
MRAKAKSNKLAIATGKAIREARTRAGLTQRRLAVMLGMTKKSGWQTVSAWESGKVEIHHGTLFKIADATGMAFWDLLKIERKFHG